MSLFGGQQPGQSLSLFSNTAKASPFGTTPNTGTQQSAFGTSTATPQPQQTGSSIFGSTTQQKPSLFGQTQQQPQQASTTGGLFGGPLGSGQGPQKPAGGLFGGTLGGGQQQQAQQQPQSGIFGGLGQTQQQQPQQQQSVFGGGSLLGGAQQRAQQQQPQLGQSTQPQGSSLWSPGRAVTGVHRTVPMQMAIVKEKWDHFNRNSPFRTYLYNSVGEGNAPFYQPGPQDDETKWEDALRQRPGSDYVPVLVRGFWELGKRAQRQKDFLTMMQARLHEINNCLTELLSRHDLKISVKIADSRRKHLVLSKRCLALAAKTQVLRNRGYAMDEAEEELKKKLAKLETSVFDPTLSGRSEEIWARMLAIREHSTRLQVELERAGSTAAKGEDELDEETMKKAKKVLDDYHSQIQHLQKELESVKKDFEEATKSVN
ncbi:putative nucleoporin [Aspergillus mulundensis]|uniref:Nuclear pore complex protein An-Nup57 n=1 Tax=Aspergillus mulundensis TaxID=1810919 RepID=A0A3D8RS39_9EURO|nr:Nuclear pore complex protein An-Nup57 [Aspergillus mulundensis]RDW76641.1 Nuclear pore complex protein An-Nup57 [Aspergillus mulundensis]